MLALLRRSTRRLHDDEGGAILLACLAACMILLMVSLTMYDAGNVTREKIKLQTATDTAAYSQASIKARTMNANAYVNVTKRSIVGLHLTYFSAFNNFYSYVQFYKQPCQLDNTQSQCQILLSPQSDCNDPHANNSGICLVTGARCCGIHIAVRERTHDFQARTGPTTPAATPNGYGGFTTVANDRRFCQVVFDASNPDNVPTCTPLSYPDGARLQGLQFSADINSNESIEPARLYGALDKYAKELRQLTRYQEYMQTITPWWAFSEALARATLNGATMATAYPPPPNLQPAGTGAYPTGATPASNMEFDWSYTNINDTLRTDTNPVGLATQLRTQRGHICSQFAGGASGMPDPLFADELGIHINTLQANSSGPAKNDPFARSVLNPDDISGNFKMLGGFSMCHAGQAGFFSTRAVGPRDRPTGSNQWDRDYDDNASSSTLFNGHRPPIFDPAISSPYVTVVDPDNASPQVRDLSQMRLSNIVFGYYQGADFLRNEGGGTSDPGMTRFEYMTQNYNTSLPEEAKGTGIWTMARGEIVTLNNDDGDWHASWTARVRPLSRPDEFSNVEVAMGIPSESFLHNAYLTAIPYLSVNQSIAHTGDPSVHHPEVWQRDSTTMERATRTMDSASTEGFTK